MVPLPDPEGVTVHQLELEDAVQPMLEVTVNTVEPAGVAGTFWFGGVTERLGGEAAWVTVTTTGVSPVTVTVICATLVIVYGFTRYAALMVPLPDPEGVTVHHALSETAVQLVLDVTVKLVEPAGEAGTFWFAGVTLKVAGMPACVTVTVWVGAPVAVTVIVATLLPTRVFTV